MKSTFLKIPFVFLFFVATSSAKSQTKFSASTPEFPDTIQIKQEQLDKLFSFRKGAFVKAPDCKYFDEAEVFLNSAENDPSKENKLLRLKLSYFPDSFLWVQVNGKYSTQVFIFSEDPSGYYKAKFSGKTIFLIKSKKESIVAE